jgi:pantoate--beta-alanine ligase
MKVTYTIAEFREIRVSLPEPLGFVPTMGYLHEGHLSLVRQARVDNASVVASIFVNPTQFAPSEDLATYPRDLEGDLSLLDKEGADAVFVPSVAEMYPSRFSSRVEVNKLTRRLEGASRPEHFSGVTTVVAKLFNIVQPTRAYFGQKDAQQSIVIKKMVADLNMNLEVVTLPTIREPDGLAMSSRNSYLSAEERQAALVLYRALMLAQGLWFQGVKDAEKLRNEMAKIIKCEPLATIDYISIANNDTLEELEEVKTPALLSLAVKINKTRLIDNVVLW